MKILIKEAKIIDSSSKHNGKICDVLINNNKIEKIAKKIQIDSETKIFKSAISLYQVKQYHEIKWDNSLKFNFCCSNCAPKVFY